MNDQFIPSAQGPCGCLETGAPQRLRYFAKNKRNSNGTQSIRKKCRRAYYMLHNKHSTISRKVTSCFGSYFRYKFFCKFLRCLRSPMKFAVRSSLLRLSHPSNPSITSIQFSVRLMYSKFFILLIFSILKMILL